MTNTRPQILLLGDSLTQLSWEGWGSRLANVYQRRADVLNRGHSGYNTEFYLQLDFASMQGNTALAIVWFGANDAAISGLADHQHVPVEKYRSNLKKICQQIGSSRILLVTPPPVHHGQRLEYQVRRYGDKATGKLERTLEHTGKYAEACREVASELGHPCLDLYTLMQEHDFGEFLCDGLHFSAEGHEFVFDSLIACINEHFVALKVDPCPITGQWCNSASRCPELSTQGPCHDEIDHTNPSAAFGK